MNELPSTEFRKRFHRLEEQTLVTVNGHPIGVWTPGTPLPGPPTEAEMAAARAYFQTPQRPPRFHGPEESWDAQTQRDELLRKINRSK